MEKKRKNDKNDNKVSFDINKTGIKENLSQSEIEKALIEYYDYLNKKTKDASKEGEE